jgi:hypothetical protein
MTNHAMTPVTRKSVPKNGQVQATTLCCTTGDIELLANHNNIPQLALGSARCWDKAELHGCAKLVELGMLLGCRQLAIFN